MPIHPRVLLVALFLLAVTPARGETLFNCTPTREYVTALEYLRSAKELALKEDDARKLAEQVSLHCTGSAERFVRVTRMLVKAGLGGTDAVKVGVEMAAAEDRTANTFVTVFKHSFLREYLDLSISASLRIARSLSLDFDGDVVAVSNDFEQLARFCAEEKHLALPRPQCAAWAADLAKKGEKVSGGVAKPFLQAFRFLTSKDGPGLTSGNALEVAKELVAISPYSVKNYIQAYQYGTSASGLKLDSIQAMQFARKMAKQTRYERAEPKASETKSKNKG